MTISQRERLDMAKSLVRERSEAFCQYLGRFRRDAAVALDQLPHILVRVEDDRKNTKEVRRILKRIGGLAQELAGLLKSLQGIPIGDLLQTLEANPDFEVPEDFDRETALFLLKSRTRHLTTRSSRQGPTFDPMEIEKYYVDENGRLRDGLHERDHPQPKQNKGRWIGDGDGIGELGRKAKALSEEDFWAGDSHAPNRRPRKPDETELGGQSRLTFAIFTLLNLWCEYSNSGVASSSYREKFVLLALEISRECGLDVPKDQRLIGDYIRPILKGKYRNRAGRFDLSGCYGPDEVPLDS